MLVSLLLVGLFLWDFLVGHRGLNYSLAVPLPVGIAAAITFIVVLVSYFAVPPEKLSVSATINYLLALATIETLIIMTGGTESAFLSFFVLVLGLAMFFGIGGFLAAGLGFAGFCVYEFVVVGIAPSQLVALATLGIVPLIASVLIWGRNPDTKAETKQDRSYHDLANELSQVAGKSEVVINAIADGVLALNGQGVIELINPAAQQLLGWGKHDAMNLSYKSVLKLVDTKNQPVSDVNDPVAQAISRNTLIKNDSFSLQTNSGKSFLASVTVSPVGQLGSGVIIVFRDVTAEKSDERQRAEFISTASHEMRTPVASIEGYLGLALNPQTAQIDEKARDFITKAHESAQHLGRLFADLLDVSKADDSRLKNDPSIVDVVPFIHDIVEGLTPKAVEKGLHILYKPMPDGAEAQMSSRLNPVYYANVDNDHLREVVQNLVENAIKYTLKGDVVVDVTGDAEHVTVSIADTGIGIPKEDLTHLFQKFYRVDNSDTREIGGTGLGLYLCRRLTETIGGRIWVDSEYKKGSTFYVEIPRIDHEQAQRLIEQASVIAEQQAQIEQQQAALGAAQSPVIEAPAPAPYTPPVAPIAAPEPLPAAYAPAPSQPIPQPAVAMPAAPLYAPQPVAAPVIQPQPMPDPVASIPPIPMNPDSVAAATVPPPAAPLAPNISLSVIEANPSQYINRQSPGIAVPPRQQ